MDFAEVPIPLSHQYSLRNKRKYGGGQYVAQTEDLINLHGPHQCIGDVNILTMVDKDDITRVGTVGQTTSDNAVFVLLWQLVYAYNTSLEKQFDDNGHICLIHPNLVHNVFDNGSHMEDQLSQLTAFSSNTNCTRFLVPVLRHNHFILLHIGTVWRQVHVHVMDSMGTDSKNIVTNEELEILAGFLYSKKKGKVKIRQVPLEFLNQQVSDPTNSNNCGICVIRNAESCLQNIEFPLDVRVYKQWIFTSQEITWSRKVFKKRLLQWAGIRIDDRDFLPNSSETKTKKKDKETPMAAPEERTKRAKLALHARMIKKSVLDEKLKYARHNQQKSVKCPVYRPRLPSSEIDEPASGGPRMLHDNHDTNFEVDDNKNLDPSVLNMFLSDSDKSISCLSRREQFNLLRRVKEIVQRAVAEKVLSSPKSQSTSSSDDQYVLDDSDLKKREFSMDQKKDIVHTYFKEKTPMEVLIKKFKLHPDVKSARVQILRMSNEISNNTPNWRQAHHLLKNRVQTLMEYKDDVQMEDIHGDDIQRTAMEQSKCFGIEKFTKKFTASTKWLHEMKKQMRFVSRHIDSRKKQPSGPNNDAVSVSIKHFLQNVVPYIRRTYSVDNIFNVDQTGLEYEMKMNRTLTKRGRNKVERVVQRKNATTHTYTLNPCISASGKLVRRTFVTLKEPNPPRSFGRLVAPYNKLYITHHSSGKMTSRLANEWMNKVFAPTVNNKSVLLIDSWPGFNEMKSLPVVARKKIEIIVIPPGATSRLQPLDISFNRQFKQFMKKLEFEIRSKTKLIIGRRDVQLQLLTLAINQFEAPRFVGLIQCGFDAIGILQTPHQPFETPAAYCFNLKATGGKLCSKCPRFCFARCAYCAQLNCVTCFKSHLH